MKTVTKAIAGLSLLITGQPALTQLDGGPEAVIVPVIPPLGQDLLYRIERSYVGSAMPQPVTLTQRIRYTEAKGQLLLEVETLEATTPAGTFANDDPFVLPVGHAATFFALISPVSFEVGEGGNLERVADWPAYEARIREKVDHQLEQLPLPNREEFRGAILPAIAAQFAQGPQAAVLGIGDPWTSFLGARGASAVPGRITISEYEYAPFGGDVEVTTENSDQLTILPDGSYRFTRKQKIDQADFARAMSDYDRRNSLTPSLSAEARQSQIEAMSETERVTEMEQIIRPDGTIKYARWETSISAIDGTVIEMTAVEISLLAGQQS